MDMTRDKQIVKTSFVGIGVNLLLSVMKLIIGGLTGSIAITMDAVNNISDAASSVITIIGTKLAGKLPDKKHPFGYGRIEYFSALMIAFLVLYAGITALQESVKSILHPESPGYTAAALVIVAAGVLAKILLGRYFIGVGNKVDSDSLTASGKDASLDAVLSFSTLLAAVIYLLTHISIEAYLGALISVVIIKSGIEMLGETISKLLGEHMDAEMAQEIKKTVRSFPEVSGAYDLVINDYGPNTHQGSIHIEVPDTLSADQIDELIRRISVKVYQEHHIALTGVGIYSVNTQDEHVIAMRSEIAGLAKSFDYVTQLHGFYVNEETKSIRFDLVISFDAPDRRGAFAAAVAGIQSRYPEYRFEVAMDTDFTGA